MAYTALNLGYTPSLGNEYTATTDSSADWGSVPNDTLFLDLTLRQVYYKDVNGVVQSNYRKLPSVQSVVSSASIAPTANDDLVEVTAQVGALTVNNPSGIYANGQNFLIRLDGDGSAITFDTKYIAFGSALPATTTVSKTTLIGCTYNSNNDAFECLNSVQQ